MKKYKKYNYQIETLSSVVLSPREQQALYLGKKAHDTDVKIIYPFYQYGTYEEYAPDKAQYYIPGSSIKGAVNQAKIMVDDVLVKRSQISLNNLYKVQDIPQPGEKSDSCKTLTADIFFQNVKIEMLKAMECLQGELYYDDKPNDILAESHKATIQKIQQWSNRFKQYINDVAGNENVEESSQKICLDQVWQKVNEIVYKADKFDRNSFLLLLGGYKGNALSYIFQEESLKSAVYVDEMTKLPHGLVKIRL